MNIHLFIGMVVQFFFLLTPFFVLSLFVSLTNGMTLREQRKLAVRTTLAILIIVLILYLLGDRIFGYLGITLDAFRIGAGLVLLLSGIEVVRSSGTPSGTRQCDDDGDVAVVPLAIPYTVGPGTIGTLLTMGAAAESTAVRLSQMAGMMIAVFMMGALLYFSATLERLLKKKGLNILSKLTGLFLAALASQLIFMHGTDTIRALIHQFYDELSSLLTSSFQVECKPIIESRQKFEDSKDVYAVLLDLYQRLSEPVQLLRNDAPHSQLRKILYYILNNHTVCKLCLKDVAAHLDISEYYICKLFRNYTNFTFTEFLNICRVEHAKNLLKSEYKVKEIAHEVGFQSSTYFGRVFRLYTTMTPREYRSRFIFR